ncbi:MAG: gliding motility-associated C-terminal domain-containing protein [Spirochaetes bacterium]|nr:gliding motility-associated C-terminal domain-containing protein [Spirochaetota bacterium]
MRKNLSLLIVGLFRIFTMYADYTPPNGGEEFYQLLSPFFLSGGPNFKSQEIPYSSRINPAASSSQQRNTLDLNYVGIADPSQDGWKGHMLNLGGILPTRYGVFSATSSLLYSSLNDVDLGFLWTLQGSVAKELFSNLAVGAGIHTTLGSKDSFDMGLGLDVGFIHTPIDFYGLKDFQWGVSLLNIGKWYAPVEGRTGFPSPFTPLIGASFTAYGSNTTPVKLGLDGSLSFPAFQNIRFSLGADLQVAERFSLRTGMSLDLAQQVRDSLAARSLIPSFGISFLFRTDLKQQVLEERGWNRSDIRVSTSAAPLHSGIWAIGGGLNVQLGVVDTNPPKIEVQYPTTVYLSPNLDGKNDVLEFPLKITDERYVMEYRFIVQNEGGITVRVIENKEKRPENQDFRGVVDRLLYVKTGIDIPEVFRWDGTGTGGRKLPDGTYRFRIEAKDDNGNLSQSPWYTVVIDATPPKVDIRIPRGSELEFSPNDDGSKDTLQIVQTGSVEEEWKGEILDAAGKVVRTFEWRNMAPPTFTWDGKDDQGNLLPDGIYAYRIRSTDRAGNSTEAGFDNIFINTEATPISLLINTSTFSPNGDGKGDTILLTPLIPITAGIEFWELTVLDDQGKTMRRYTGTRNAPLPIEFDGRMEGGTILPEGTYTAKLKVLYRNGNKPEAVSPPFTVDLTPPSARIRSNLAVFSPNGDGSKDEIEFFLDTSTEDQWIGFIRDSEGRTIKTYRWMGKPPERISWNGVNDSGTLSKDGKYTFQLESEDRAGNQGLSNRIEFNINTEETPVILSSDLSAFSPNGDGVKDVVRFRPTVLVNTGIEQYSLSVKDSKGTAIRTYRGRGRVDSEYIWDGLDERGNRVPDGEYSAELVVLYENGNRGVSRIGSILVDTEPPRVTLSTPYTLFSPDGDGEKDTLPIVQDSSIESQWIGTVENSLGVPVRTFTWNGKAASFVWDGKDQSGNLVADGMYRYTVRAEDAAGNRGQGMIPIIQIDTRRVSAFVTVNAPGFSPNGDGVKDTIEITVFLNIVDGIEQWSLSLVDQTNTVRKSYKGVEISSPFRVQWNGRGDDGRIVEGTYTARFEATYRKGNKPVARSTPFLLDVSGPVLRVRLDPIPFSPDNDGIADELNIHLTTEDLSPIESWSFLIYDRNDVLFRSFKGTGNPPSRIIWDGYSDKGELVISAEDYKYVYRAIDMYGNAQDARGIIPVDILVIRDGDRFKIKISSITFAPNSPVVILDQSEQGRKNAAVLDRLVEVLTKYSNYQIRIEGHANNITGTMREEIEELQPLSLARAEAVRRILIQRGLGARRIDVEGKGGKEMLFPSSDLENSWKNRRVEFILIR